MNLDQIAAGSLCVLDTNILLYAEQGTSLQAQRLLRRIGNGEILGVLPQPVWHTRHRDLSPFRYLARQTSLGII